MYEGILGVKKPIAGLDIGHDTLKVVQLKGEGKKASIIGAAEISIPVNSLTKEGVKDKAAVADLIKKAVNGAKPHRISAKIISTALPESLVFTKSLDMPKMTYAEINKNIPYQATEFFPMPVEETYMDWHIIGSMPGRNTVEVLVVAAPKILIDSLCETVKMAGLELLGLETKPIAVTRALLNENDLNPYLIMDIGAEHSGFTCIDQGNIKLTSTTACGGNQIQKDAAATLKTLASEAIHLIKYYQNRIGQAQVFKKIILAGGGSSIPNTAESIEKLTTIKTEVGHPIITLKNYHPKFAAAIGLAMKKI